MATTMKSLMKTLMSHSWKLVIALHQTGTTATVYQTYSLPITNLTRGLASTQDESVYQES